jgi:hypothetical protein
MASSGVSPTDNPYNQQLRNGRMAPAAAASAPNVQRVATQQLNLQGGVSPTQVGEFDYAGQADRYGAELRGPKADGQSWEEWRKDVVATMRVSQERRDVLVRKSFLSPEEVLEIIEIEGTLVDTWMRVMRAVREQRKKAGASASTPVAAAGHERQAASVRVRAPAAGFQEEGGGADERIEGLIQRSQNLLESCERTRLSLLVARKQGLEAAKVKLEGVIENYQRCWEKDGDQFPDARQAVEGSIREKLAAHTIVGQRILDVNREIERTRKELIEALRAQRDELNEALKSQRGQSTASSRRLLEMLLGPEILRLSEALASLQAEER